MKRKKIKTFFKLPMCIGGWMRERKTERQSTEMKREEREILYTILLCNLYYFNM